MCLLLWKNAPSPPPPASHLGAGGGNRVCSLHGLGVERGPTAGREPGLIGGRASQAKRRHTMLFDFRQSSDTASAVNPMTPWRHGCKYSISLVSPRKAGCSIKYSAAWSGSNSLCSDSPLSTLNKNVSDRAALHITNLVPRPQRVEPNEPM